MLHLGVTFGRTLLTPVQRLGDEKEMCSTLFDQTLAIKKAGYMFTSENV